MTDFKKKGSKIFSTVLIAALIILMTAVIVPGVTGATTRDQTGYICISGICTPSSWGAPVAGFTGTPTSGCVPLTVAFTDTSTGSPTSWSWTFGDGGTSTDKNPTHTYTVAGTYTVTLTATNARGSNVATRTNYITVSSVPVASFNGTPTSGPIPLTVVFTDASTGGPTSWSWDFGDGGTSTLRNPSHTYTVAGNYTVNLTVTNNCGGSWTIRAIRASLPSAPGGKFHRNSDEWSHSVDRGIDRYIDRQAPHPGHGPLVMAVSRPSRTHPTRIPLRGPIRSRSSRPMPAGATRQLKRTSPMRDYRTCLLGWPATSRFCQKQESPTFRHLQLVEMWERVRLPVRQLPD